MRFSIHGWRTINITYDFFIMTVIYFIFNNFRIELSMKFHKYNKMMLLNHSLCFWMRIFDVCRNNYYYYYYYDYDLLPNETKQKSRNFRFIINLKFLWNLLFFQLLVSLYQNFLLLIDKLM